MRIALISPYTLPNKRGNAFTAERIKNGLLDKGFSVSLFNAFENSCQDTTNFSPDIIHCFHATRPWKCISELYQQISPPLVVTLTGTDYDDKHNGTSSTSVFTNMVNMASAIILFHDRFKDRLVKELSIPEKKIHIIPQSVDIRNPAIDDNEVRKKYGFKKDDILVLMAGGIRKIKNLEYAVQALHEIENIHPDVKLLMAGPVIEQDVADKFFTSASKLKCFSYLGELDQNDLRSLMHASDIFLNTSITEGMSGAIQEAMAETVPIVATDIIGNESLIDDSQNGFLVPLDQPDILTDRLCTLISDRRLRIRMGTEGRQKIKQYFSPEKEIEQHIALYRKLIMTS